MSKKKQEQPKAQIFEHTITCLTCGYTCSEGNLPHMSQMDYEEIILTAKHNPGCKVTCMTCKKYVSINSVIDDSNPSLTITKYTIQLM